MGETQVCAGKKGWGGVFFDSSFKGIREVSSFRWEYNISKILFILQNSEQCTFDPDPCSTLSC